MGERKKFGYHFSSNRKVIKSSDKSEKTELLIIFRVKLIEILIKWVVSSSLNKNIRFKISINKMKR